MERLTTERKEFIAARLSEFKAFVLDSMDEGHDQEFENHFDFLEAAMRTWSDSNWAESNWSETDGEQQNVPFKWVYARRPR